MMEDDDDTHICLKCHTTITGLDNYVTHRKTGCGNQPPGHSKPQILSPLIPQDEPDFSLKADDFFSLLELQSSSKKSSIPVSSVTKTNSGVLTRSKATAVIQASNINRGSDWIGGHLLRELGNEDNQTKLIKAVDNISGNIKKEEPTRLSYPHVLDEDSNDDYEDEEEDFEEDCHNVPPRTHTGGKWKPSSSPIQWLRHWNPPPSHTGGKWKPPEEEKHPPPDHTKGKWIPGTIEVPEEIPPLRKSCGTVQYWCGPCNRRLASKIVYERHLRSELHYKRTLHEREFEDSSDYLNQKVSKRQGKRKLKKHAWPEEDSKKKKKQRTKKHVYVKCEVCRSKVFNYQMGKHLISHYHCRKRHNFKPISQQMVLDHILGVVLQSPFQCGLCRFYFNDEAQFLQHWRSETHLECSKTPGYFLCTFCKFQTEYNEIMMQHLLSDPHREVVSVINRSVPIIIKRIAPVKCETCGNNFRYNIELRQHSLRTNHALTASSTDKYQEKHFCTDCPLVLKSYKALQKHLLKKHGKNYFFCSACSITFPTYLESKLHRKSLQHKCTVLSKNPQNKDITRQCQHCQLRFENLFFLKQHLQQKHPEEAFRCPQCGQKFTLSQEITQHIKSKSCIFPSTSSLNSNYFNCEKCPYNTNSEADFLFHLALHEDSVPVIYPEVDSGPGTSKQTGKKIQMYKCPICEKIFRKASLRCHIRQHVNERPYKCEKCKSTYTRKSNLMEHVKMKHSEEYKRNRSEDRRGEHQQDFEETQLTARNEAAEDEEAKNEKTGEISMREKKYLCANCGASFLKKYTLQQHSCTHSAVKEFLCEFSGCIYSARSLAELKTHSVTHQDLKAFACAQCSHRTKTKAQLNRHVKIHQGDVGKRFTCPFCTFSARIKSHLKRHLRLHTGAKPYKCPHCEYSCNNLENLRKHILSTNKHPGKSIYTCRSCSEGYATNFAKEFHFHLVSAHPDRYDVASAKEAASRILGIYNKEEDEKVIEDTTMLPTSSSNPPRYPPASLVPTSSSATLDPELLSMVVVKEDVVFVSGETWAMEGFYEVEGATLVNYGDEQGLLGSEGFEEDD